MTDEQLLVDFLSHRDGSAFEGLVRRYGPMVFRVCRDVLGDPEDAEDAFQATFLVLLRQAGSIRERSSIGRWLYEVACRISRRERRRVARLRFQERQAPAMDAAAPPDDDPADRELKPILHDEIRRLPAKLRDPILLCYFEGLTVEDAARRLCCPVGTLKSRLVKGRELLRVAIDPPGAGRLGAALADVLADRGGHGGRPRALARLHRQSRPDSRRQAQRLPASGHDGHRRRGPEATGEAGRLLESCFAARDGLRGLASVVGEADSGRDRDGLAVGESVGHAIGRHGDGLELVAVGRDLFFALPGPIGPAGRHPVRSGPIGS